VDRLTIPAVCVLVLAVSGCGSARPKQLLDGEPAGEFRPVHGSVLALGRALPGTALGRRFAVCRPPDVPADAVVVERIGVLGESLTFADRNRTTLHSCDGGIDPAGEHTPPWCNGSTGLLRAGKLLDPRLDIVCRDRRGTPLAYVWVEPVAGARWIGVDQGSYTEIYEVLAGLPVRVAGTRHVELERACGSFEVTQYDLSGRQLLRGLLVASVAG
jgi:hypothetical protein